MKNITLPNFAKWTLSALATTVVASGIVYAATISTVKTQTIAPGDTIGEGWFQSVNDKLATSSNGGTSGGTCILTEYESGNIGCPVGSTLTSIKHTCGEDHCGGGYGSATCRYFDGTHIGESGVKCYPQPIPEGAEYELCDGQYTPDGTRYQNYSNGQGQAIGRGSAGYCPDNQGGGG